MFSERSASAERLIDSIVLPSTNWQSPGALQLFAQQQLVRTEHRGPEINACASVRNPSGQLTILTKIVLSLSRQVLRQCRNIYRLLPNPFTQSQTVSLQAGTMGLFETPGPRDSSLTPLRKYLHGSCRARLAFHGILRTQALQKYLSFDYRLQL